MRLTLALLTAILLAGCLAAPSPIDPTKSYKIPEGFYVAKDLQKHGWSIVGSKRQTIWLNDTGIEIIVAIDDSQPMPNYYVSGEGAAVLEQTKKIFPKEILLDSRKLTVNDKVWFGLRLTGSLDGNDYVHFVLISTLDGYYASIHMYIAKEKFEELKPVISEFLEKNSPRPASQQIGEKN